MVFEKVSFGNCVIFALALAEVTSWTIDLPEVRKFFFEKNALEKKYEDYRYKKEDRETQYYNNIEGNSKHNSEHYDDLYDNTAYAKGYGYESYMEKKVHGIVYNGSVYLEGLRRSLENYTRFLESCRMNSRNESSNRNTTAWRLPVEFPFNSTTNTMTNPDNSTNFMRNSDSSTNFMTNSDSSTNFMTNSDNSTNFMRNSDNSTNFMRNSDNSTNFMRNSDNSTNFMRDGNFTNTRCREATRDSEHVRRLSELAMWATRELQDIAYARKYKKGDQHELTMEENELILKLAWFLDRLAHYTGYEPEPKDFVDKDDERTTTPPPPATPPGSPSPELTRAMMECLRSNSSQPADERCRYPEPLPPIVQTMMEMNSNISGIPSITASSNRYDQIVPLSSRSRQDPVSEQSMELLIASDNRIPTANYPPYSNFPPFLTAVRNVQKRSVSSMPEPEAFENAPKFKSSIEDDPAIHFLKYYAKHKVWEGSNIKNTDHRFEEYEVKNHLATHGVQKRAIINKKAKHLMLPENPFQDLSKYIKQKPGVNYVKDEAQAVKIKAALEKIENIKSVSAKSLMIKLKKTLRQKRAVKYEKDVDLPRESVDPQGDISYYTKNKPGRNYNRNLVQAAQVRAGLEKIFNTGNIEVVRRFGANYNPLIPAPFYAGVLKSQADF